MKPDEEELVIPVWILSVSEGREGGGSPSSWRMIARRRSFSRSVSRCCSWKTLILRW